MAPIGDVRVCRLSTCLISFSLAATQRRLHVKRNRLRVNGNAISVGERNPRSPPEIALNRVAIPSVLQAISSGSRLNDL